MIGALAGAAAVLLAVAGVAKTIAPAQAARMLRTASPALARRRALLPPAVRALGAAEFGVGVAALADGGRWPMGLLALTYLGFLGITVALMRRPVATSCGCFGRVDSPVEAAHLVLNAAALTCAVTASIRPPGPLAGYADAGPATAVTGVGQVLLLAGLAYLAVTALPALTSARRLAEEPA